MATYEIVPTQEMQEEARRRGLDPQKYINRFAIFIADPKYDGRRVGVEDIMIKRKDGTKVIVHELQSDIEKFEKLELLEVDDQNRIIEKRCAYADRVDFSRMQLDAQYLDCFGDELISQGRLASKQQIARSYGLEEIYIGLVERNPKTGRYQKFCTGRDEEVLKKIIEKKRMKKEQEEASIMIDAILAREKEKLSQLPFRELKAMYNRYNIEIDNNTKEER